MAQFTITLPDELENEVRSSVRKGGYGSISDFIRDAIKSELSQKPKYWERVTIALLLENNKLLKTVADENAIEEGELLSALKSGYSSNYYNIENIVSRDELTKEDAHFVMDVLEMYAELQRAAEVYGFDEKATEKTLFEGFDGNAGDGYLGYTNFLVDNGRFAHVKPLDKTPHLNSHFPVNEVYRRMLAEYKRTKNIKRLEKPYTYEILTEAEASQVLDAQIHPDHRKSS